MCPCSQCVLPVPILTELRDLLVQLLFLEADSYKWYSDHSIPYFLLFASRIDKSLNSTINNELGEVISARATNPKNILISPRSSIECIPTKFIHDLLANHLFTILKIEIEALKRILLYFPSGGAGSIPEEFRRVDPEGMGKKWQVKEYDLDNDGIIIID